MINPTNGRQVWFYPNGTYMAADANKGQPLAATIVHVWHDRMVNLQVLDAQGRAFQVTSVQLLQDDDAAPAQGVYAGWMPYQKGQAAKHAAENDVPAHVQRMVEEKTQLAERFTKLTQFIDAPERFESLPHTEQMLLREQQSAMRYYLQVLSTRLTLAGQ